MTLALGCDSPQGNDTQYLEQIDSLKAIIENKSNIDGKFISKKGLVRELEFIGSHCNFVYCGIAMGGKYEIDQGFVYIYTGSELGNLSLEIIDKNTLQGSGWASGTFIRINQKQ